MCIPCDGVFVHHCHCSVLLCSSKSVSGKVEESEVSRARRLAGLQEEPKEESKLCTAIALKSHPCRLWTVNDSDTGEGEVESKVDRGRRSRPEILPPPMCTHIRMHLLKEYQHSWCMGGWSISRKEVVKILTVVAVVIGGVYGRGPTSYRDGLQYE